MNAIDIQNQPGRYVISIDKKAFRQEFMLDLLERLPVERLAKTIDFDESIRASGEGINASWWQKNKQCFIREQA